MQLDNYSFAYSKYSGFNYVIFMSHSSNSQLRQYPCQILASVLCRNVAINHCANRFGVAKHRWAKSFRLRNNIHHCSRSNRLHFQRACRVGVAFDASNSDPDPDPDPNRARPRPKPWLRAAWQGAESRRKDAVCLCVWRPCKTRLHPNRPSLTNLPAISRCVITFECRPALPACLLAPPSSSTCESRRRRSCAAYKCLIYASKCLNRSQKVFAIASAAVVVVAALGVDSGWLCGLVDFPLPHNGGTLSSLKPPTRAAYPIGAFSASSMTLTLKTSTLSLSAAPPPTAPPNAPEALPRPLFALSYKSIHLLHYEEVCFMPSTCAYLLLAFAICLPKSLSSSL